MKDTLKNGINAVIDKLEEPDFKKLSKEIDNQTGEIDSLQKCKIVDSIIERIRKKKNWNDDQKNEIIEEINRHKKNPFNLNTTSWEEFEQSVRKSSSKDDYFSKIFIDNSGMSRRFPVGTVSYIGARPGRGKTTVLVSSAIDAINAGKKAVFITAEETPKQIITRFIANYLYGFSLGNDKMKPYIQQLQENQKVRDEIYGYIKGNKSEYNNVLKKSVDKVKELINEQQLTIFNACGINFEALTDYLKTLEIGTVVLIDYIQRLRAPEKLITQTRQIQVQRVSNTIANIAGEKEMVLIVGAQLNRGAVNNGADELNEALFREAGDIEQDGHILIQMGDNQNEGTKFYLCLKDREGEPDKTERNLETALAFSYVAPKPTNVGDSTECIRKEKENDRCNEMEYFCSSPKYIKKGKAILRNGWDD